ncbi:MAG TPA: hypothetical protein VEW93_12425 [Acidimicrobiales bacterium]|nr:hypothetical protein [Acidimicrobiales bacterium]
MVAAAVGAVATGRWAVARLAGEEAPGPVAVAAGARPVGLACPELPPLDAPPGAREMEADLLGTGCPVPLAWDGRVLSVRLAPTDVAPRRYQLDARRGGSGQLLLGDWDCDGSETPGYYQPATGVVSYFGPVPERVGQKLSARTEDTGVLDGRATVTGGGAEGCDGLEVVPRA